MPVQVPTAIASGDPFADLAGDSLLTVKEASERLESGGIGTMANTNVYCAILDGSFGCKTGYNNEDGLVVAAAYENRWFNSQNDGFVVIIFNPKYSVGCTSTTSDFEGGANFGSAYQDRVSSIKTFSGCDISLWSRRDLQFEGTSWIDSEDDLSPLVGTTRRNLSRSRDLVA